MTREENIDFVIRELQSMNGTHYALPRSLTDKQRLMRALMNMWQPQPLSDEFVQAQDRELQAQKDDKGVVSPSSNGISVWQGDITRLQVDAIVNAANSQMLGCFQPLHACIDNAIHSAAGLQLRQECYEQMCIQGHEEPTGKARLTKGYNLPAKYVLHTVGPICTPQGSWLDIIRSIKEDIPTALQRQQLADSYRNCLDKAAEAGCESMAFCCISTGVFGFPNEPAAQIAIQTVKDWLASSKKSMQVIFCVFKDIDKQIYNKIL